MNVAANSISGEGTVQTSLLSHSKSSQGVSTRRQHQHLSSVHSSTSSSYNSLGVMQYVDPDGGEPVYFEDFNTLSSQQHTQTPFATPQIEQYPSVGDLKSEVEIPPKGNLERKSLVRRASSRRRISEYEDCTVQRIEEEYEQDQSEETSKLPALQPLHDVDPPAEPNFYQYEMEYEVHLQTLRNKRVLMARLTEVMNRGRLSMINLSRRGLGVTESMLLSEAIIANPRLSVLKLAYNDLGDNGVSLISSAFLQNGKHHNLSVLDLGFNSIGDKGCGSLAVHCLAGNFNLQKLYLSGNQITEKGALSIAGAILHGTGLRSLHLSANSIGPSGANAIVGAIAKNESRWSEASEKSGGVSLSHGMEELHLGCTSITSEGFLAIPAMLLTNTSLKSICVSSNNLNDQDIILLSQALSQNKLVALESLRLSFNQITCQGVECLMNAVWGSKTLRELKLDSNRVQDRGAQLCAVVLTSVDLEILDLSFNKITTVGIKALMKNLSDNSSLQTLGLSGIPIDQNASKALSYALAYNISLQALYLDNCSTGYASQRHIVAGAVSNRKSALRIITGFLICPIAVSLGMPNLPEIWSNDQVLGFFRLMWQQWLLKSRNGRSEESFEEMRGPAPPAAVAAAAKIAFSALGNNPEKLFKTELHGKPLTEQAPVEPASAALLERTPSGTLSIPLFTVSSEVGIDDFVDGESKVAAMANSSTTPTLSTVRSPLENPERRLKNLRWLRLHFRALSDVGRLPFHNADLWQLHQFYFSPPSFHVDEEKLPRSIDESMSRAPPPTPNMQSRMMIMNSDCVKTFPALLGEALLLARKNTYDHSHKRGSMHSSNSDDDGPLTKRVKSLRPRIAYYPRIMAKIEALGTKPMDQNLSLLRQLKYIESVMFADLL